MDTITDQIARSHEQAAATQSAQRTTRRVVRRNPPNASQPVEVISPDELDDPGMETLSYPAPATVSPDASLPVMATPAAAPQIVTSSPLDLPSEQFSSGLTRRKQNRQLLLDWLRTALVEGVDYGRVHVAGKDKCELARSGRAKDCTNQYHWSKPNLFKPGAEKITGMLGITVHYPSLSAYEQALLSGTEITQILMRCELHDANGHVVAEGVGARNLTQDYGDINKSLKMAEKSAHIDATLRLAGLSEVFTQDLEDKPGNGDNGDASDPAPPPAQTSPPRRTASTAKPSPVEDQFAPESTPERITSDDVKNLRHKILTLGFTEARVLAWLTKATQGTVHRLDQLNVDQCANLLRKLDEWANPGSSGAPAAPVPPNRRRGTAASATA